MLLAALLATPGPASVAAPPLKHVQAYTYDLPNHNALGNDTLPERGPPVAAYNSYAATAGDPEPGGISARPTGPDSPLAYRYDVSARLVQVAGITRAAAQPTMATSGDLPSSARSGVAADGADAASTVRPGFGVGSTPSRLRGPWSADDLKQGAFGRPPRSLGRPDLHHADQMPGSGIHEIPPSMHRGNASMHPNKYNQGVTDEMRMQDRQLHWWYRSQEMGGWDILGPGYYYDNWP